MYYIGEILHNDLDINGKPIIGLWDGAGYSLSEAKKELVKISKKHHIVFLEIISDKEYDIVSSQGWE